MKKGLIIKSNFELEYKPEDFIKAEGDAKKRLREYEAQKKIYDAKADNVARNHKKVLKVSDEDRNAIWLYQENFVASKQLAEMIKKLKKGIKDLEKEMKEIEKQTNYNFNEGK